MPQGLALTTTDPEGNTSTNQYDSNGNLTVSTDAAGNKTTLAYDARGNVTSTVQGQGDAFVFQYNAAGELTTFDGSGALPQTRTVDANDNPTSASTLWTDPSNPNNQQVLTSSVKYNADGKVTERH